MNEATFDSQIELFPVDFCALTEIGGEVTRRVTYFCETAEDADKLAASYNADFEKKTNTRAEITVRSVFVSVRALVSMTKAKGMECHGVSNCYYDGPSKI
jgi:hypothetical protein